MPPPLWRLRWLISVKCTYNWIFCVTDCHRFTYLFIVWMTHWCFHGGINALQWRLMGAITSQITSLIIVYWIVNSGAGQSKHQISASLAFVRGIHQRLVNSPHKWPVTRKKFLFDHVIMVTKNISLDKIKWVSWNSWTRRCPGNILIVI